MAELGFAELGFAELGAGEDSGSSPVFLVLSITATSSVSAQLDGVNMVFVVGSTVTVSAKLTVAVPLQLSISAQSTMSVASLFAARYFGIHAAGQSTVELFLTIDEYLHPDVIAGHSTMAVHLTGGAPATELAMSIVAESSVSLQLTVEVNAQLNWQGQSSVIIRGQATETQTAAMSWSGESHLSILAGFVPQGSTAEIAIHIAESNGGIWTATFEGDTTGVLAWNISASALQTALEGLPSIGVGNVVVTGGPGGAQPFSVRFAGSLENTPVGMITTNSAGLTGPDGLNPRASVISLSPGYSEDDDYGSVDDISIKVENVYSYHQYKGVQIGLKITESDDGGDESASWTVDMTPPYALPKVNSKVLISDLRGGFWVGLLDQPHYSIKYGYMRVEMSAHGYFVTTHDYPVDRRRIFLIGTLTRTIFSEMRNELSQARLSITDDFLAAGKSIPNDTEDLYGQYLGDIIDHFATLGDYDDTRLCFGVRLPMEPGYLPEEPILYVEREASVPTLSVSLQAGAEVDGGIDGSEIVNRYFVPWEIPDDPLERSGTAIIDHPTSALPSETDRLRAQTVGQTFPSVVEAESFGTLLAARHGVYRTVGGSLKIAGGVPVFTMDGHVFPHWRIRPNIMFDIPDLPTLEEGLPPVDLRASKYSWEQITDAVAISMGELGDLRREFRQLVHSPDQMGSQPNEPVTRTLEGGNDKSSPAPWKGNDARDFNDPLAHVPPVVSAENTATSVRTITLMFSVPAEDPSGICQVDFDCILRGVTLYSPLGQDGSAAIIVGHSTKAHYGEINNLTNLSVAGNNKVAEDMQVRQQLLAGDVVYAAFPTPMTGYTYITVALTCERSW